MLLPDVYQNVYDRIGEILVRDVGIRTGTLGRINAVEILIDLTKHSRSIFSALYQARPGACKLEKQGFQSQQKAVVVYVKRHILKAQARYRFHLGARFRHTDNVVLPGDMMFVRSTLVAHLHKLGSVCNNCFMGVTVSSHILPIQGFDKFVKRISLWRVGKLSYKHGHKNPSRPTVFDDICRLLDLHVWHCPHSAISHSSTFGEGGTGSKSIPIDNSATLLYPQRWILSCTGSGRFF